MNPIPALTRTITAYLIGAIAAGLILGGIAISDEASAALAGALTIVIANAYYLLVTLAARVVPWIGYLLIIPTEPTYGAGADLFWAFLRTLIPSVVGWAISLIPTSFLVLDDATVSSIVIAIVAATQSLYYAVLKIAETHVPWLSILLGGKPTAQPVYLPRHAA